ncbi:hypothetical protein F4774DRAFT_370748 [Daldinia eschscholtzii]|nr:hypothetical protein F4774DRAFT_370748 [Daldinia eschscholtzii]
MYEIRSLSKGSLKARRGILFICLFVLLGSLNSIRMSRRTTCSKYRVLHFNPRNQLRAEYLLIMQRNKTDNFRRPMSYRGRQWSIMNYVLYNMPLANPLAAPVDCLLINSQQTRAL